MNLQLTRNSGDEVQQRYGTPDNIPGPQMNCELLVLHNDVKEEDKISRDVLLPNMDAFLKTKLLKSANSVESTSTACMMNLFELLSCRRILLL